MGPSPGPSATKIMDPCTSGSVPRRALVVPPERFRVFLEALLEELKLLRLRGHRAPGGKWGKVVAGVHPAY